MHGIIMEACLGSLLNAGLTAKLEHQTANPNAKTQVAEKETSTCRHEICMGTDSGNTVERESLDRLVPRISRFPITFSYSSRVTAGPVMGVS